jgi:glycosyltransferase 2 family protein
LKGRIADILKVVIPLGIGVYVAWYQFDKLTDDQLSAILDSFRSANYFWVALSMLLGIMSHWSRAFRWKYLLHPMNISIRFINGFLSVLIGYVANLVLPRFGEVWRCVLVARFEKQPFEKLFGSVVAERIADVIVVSCVMVVTVALQLALLGEKLDELLGDRLSPKAMPALIAKLAIAGAVGLAFAFGFWRLLQHSTMPLFVKLRGFIAGLAEGVTSILRMESKWSFVGHTLFIWTMYLGMFWLPFLSLPETAHVPLGGMLAAFFMGSLSIALVQGGIGIYPIAVAETLRLYDVPYESGLALGWIIWTAQTGLIVVFGIASMVAMPLINGERKEML